jgi:hypothetical protein
MEILIDIETFKSALEFADGSLESTSDSLKEMQ